MPGTEADEDEIMALGDALRAAGRVANDSLQGFQLVYGCPRGKLAEDTWNHLVTTMTVDGFTGSIDPD